MNYRFQITDRENGTRTQYWTEGGKAYAAHLEYFQQIGWRQLFPAEEICMEDLEDIAEETDLSAIMYDTIEEYLEDAAWALPGVSLEDLAEDLEAAGFLTQDIDALLTNPEFIEAWNEFQAA